MKTFTTNLRLLLETLTGFFWPNVCQICGGHRAGRHEGYVCPACRAAKGGVRFVTPPFCGRCGLPFQGEITGAFECGNCRDTKFHFRRAQAAVTATPLVLEVVHRYKYGRQTWFEPFLAELLLSRAEPELRREKWDRIVPVPLHPLKKRERGFNQSERLAGHLARRLGLPVDARLVERIQPTRTQTLLSREQRAANVRGAFAPRRGKKLDGQNVLLVDDVFTTGATVNACAGALKEAGAGDVCVWTVARGL